jgi:hypothetical protein
VPRPRARNVPLWMTSAVALGVWMVLLLLVALRLV